MGWGRLARIGTSFHSSRCVCRGTAHSLVEKMWRYMLVVAVSNCTRYNWTCSPGQVCCRRASQGGVKFGLLDNLEPPPGDND